MISLFFFFQAEDGIRDIGVTGVQTCALPIYQYRYSTADQFLVSQVDFTSPGGRDFFGRLLRDAIDDGFDGWMEDFGEYTPPDARSADGTPGAAMHNLYPTLYHRTATEQTANAGRPIANYVRSGWTGTAAHARIVWEIGRASCRERV